jgi:hypothetical protein
MACSKCGAPKKKRVAVLSVKEYSVDYGSEFSTPSATFGTKDFFTARVNGVLKEFKTGQVYTVPQYEAMSLATEGAPIWIFSSG